MSSTGLMASEEGGRVDFARLRSQRRQRLIDAMAGDDLDALILGRPANVRYASGARQLWTSGIRPFAPSCVAVRTSGAVHLLSVWDEGVPTDIPNEHLFGLSWNPARLMESLASIPGLDGARRIGTDGLTPLFAEMFAATWPAADLIDGRSAIRVARRTKTPDELACIATATAVAEAGLSAVLDVLASVPAGMTERDLTGVFAERVALLGLPLTASEGVACATEQQGAVTRRQVPSDRVVLPGQLVTLDAGVIYAGYEGGLARTWAAGGGTAGGAWAERAKLAGRCWGALDALVEQCRSGRSGDDLYRAWEATGEQSAAIPLAYGVGVGVEPPIIGSGRGRDVILQSGDVLAVQAWVQREGVGGFLAREVVRVWDGAADVLSRFGRGPH